MNINKSAMIMLAGAVAAVLSVHAGAGKESNLNLDTATTNVVVATYAAPETVTTAPGWTNAAPATLQAVAGSDDYYFEIDNDGMATPSEASVYAQVITSNKYVEVSFDMLAAAVPGSTASLTTTFGSTVPQLAFCIWDAHGTDPVTNRAYWAYVKNPDGTTGWTNVCDCALADDTNYVLKATFDYSGKTNFVKFAVKALDDAAFTELNGGAWYEMASSATGITTYDFLGDGYVKKFETAMFELASEEIVIPGQEDKEPMIVEEEDKKAFDTLISGGIVIDAGTASEKTITSVSELMAADTGDVFASAPTTIQEMSVSEAYALGIVVQTNDNSTTTMALKDEGKVIVSGQATAAGENITIGLNIEPPTGTGATLSYQLKGSADGETWENVGSASSTVPSIPKSVIGKGDGKYRFFKVEASAEMPTK